jgi:hypothetical protein
MKLVIEDSVFASGATLEVAQLLAASQSSRFRVIPEDENGTGYVGWLGQQPPKIAADYEACIDISYDSESREPSQIAVRVSAQTPTTWSQGAVVVSPQEAVQLIRKPYSILVENGVNDRAFLLAVATPTQRERLLELEDDGSLLFQNGGGLGTMMQVLRAELARDQDLHLRKYVVFDSDALQPGQPSQQSEDLAKVCATNVPYHQLQRRAMENYLPKQALSAWAHHRNRRRQLSRLFRTFCSLSAAQRHHFNMKHGFSRETPAPLYTGVDTSDLATGFGSNVGSLFTTRLVTDQHVQSSNVRDELGPVISDLITRIC